MARLQLNERDAHSVDFSLKVGGVLTVPASVRWRVDCVTTQTEVIAWTVITPASSGTITIPASANDIVNNSNASETKRITVQANYDTDSQVNAYYEWDVVNNEFYT